MLNNSCRQAIEKAVLEFVERRKYISYRNLTVSKDLTKASIVVLEDDADGEVGEDLLFFKVSLDIKHDMSVTEIDVHLVIMEM